MVFGTFHSVCIRLLRRHGYRLPAIVPGRFSIVDSEESLKMLKPIVMEHGWGADKVMVKWKRLGEGGDSGKHFLTGSAVYAYRELLCEPSGQ